MIPYLKKLGKDHVGYGVVPQYYEIFKQVWCKTLKKVLKEDYSVAVD